MDETALKRLVENIKIDKEHIVFYFRCPKTHRVIKSELPFEPYSGKIEFTWQELLLHPIDSYNRYYHTPIIIYDQKNEETILKKAFERVADQFLWDEPHGRYICIER